MNTIAAVMPTYRHGHLIGRALKSIVPQVDCLIVVDDASPDDTRKRVEAVMKPDSIRHVSYVRLPKNSGTATAINVGTAILREMAHNNDKFGWWTWVSSDNEHRPSWREQLLRYAKHDVGVVYSGFTLKKNDRDRGRHHFTQHYYGRLLESPDCYYGPSFLIRPDIWERVGRHRGGTAHDYDHWTRVEEVTRSLGLSVTGIEASLVDYYRHPETSVKRGDRPADAEYWRQEAIKRRADVVLEEFCE